jgi:hypothetical protein
LIRQSRQIFHNVSFDESLGADTAAWGPNRTTCRRDANDGSTSRRDRFITVSMLARTPAAVKKRRYRQRLHDGIVVLKIEAHECELAEALIASERLGAAESAKRDALAHAVEGVLREWIQRWLHKT